MKSKKGFTMMELLAAIVIVGILSTIGIVGVVNFRKNQEIKYNKTQNSMFIETAKTYFSDNKKYLPTKPGTSENVYVTLGELIEANYITEDFIDYNGKKYSPDSKVLVLKINNGVYTYRGSLLDEDGDTVITTEKAKVDWDFKYKNKTSDLNKINNKNYTNSTPSMTFKATSKNGINILAYMYIIYRDGVVYETSEMIYLGMKLELNDELILDLDTEKYSGDAQYKIKIKLYDESGYEIIKEGEDIVIDTVAPNAPQLVNLYENKWINKSYTIKGKATDSSGILEWQHTYKSDAGNGINNSDWKKYSNSSKNSFTTSAFEDEMDKYVYIRVCDYANNCSLSSRSKIRIDKTAPICEEPTGGNPTWINAKSSTTSRTITATCDDTKKGTTHSGCVKNSISHTYAEDIDTKEAGAAGNKDGGTVRDTAGNVTNCKANQTVKIDKTAPTKPSLTNPNDNVWVNKVKFNSSGFSYTIKGTTKENLSGVDYWQYTYNNAATSTGSDSNSTWVTYSNSSKSPFTTTPFTADRKQNVYIRVCDKAGNCSEKSSSMIKIDKTEPTCGSWSGEAPSSTSWAKTRTISVGCNDTTSQCTASSYTVKQYNSGTIKTDNLSQTIKDNAGNTNTCSKNSVPIYIDNDAPSCANSGGSSGWTNIIPVTITGTCNDNGGSGCKANATKSYSLDGDYTNESPGDVCDAVGNCRACASDRTIKIDTTAPSCSVSKSNTGKTSGVTTSVSCSDGLSGCSGSNSTGDSGLKSSKTYTVYDNAGNSNTCSVSVSSQTQYNLGGRCASSRRGCKTSECTARSKCNCSWNSCGGYSKNKKNLGKLGTWSSSFVSGSTCYKNCESQTTSDGSFVVLCNVGSRSQTCKSGDNCPCISTKCTEYKCDGGKCGWGGWTTTACTPASDCTIGGSQVCCKTRVVYN